MMNPKHCKWFVLIILVPTLLVWMSINWLINPFDFYSSPSLPHFNQVKIAMGTHQRLHCALEIARQKPTRLILGSSRCNNGLNPSHLEDLGYTNAYNAAFGLANMQEIYYFLEHAFYHQPHLQQVIIGIDFFSFGKGNSHNHCFWPNNHLKEKIFSPFQYFHFLFKPLKYSHEAWNANYSSDNLDMIYLPNGLWNPTLSVSKTNPYFGKSDFLWVRDALRAKTYYYNYKLSRKQVRFFKKTVQFCQEKKIELKIFFCPAKALYWEGLYLSELWPTFENLKRKLVAIHPLWDFSGFNCVTTEALETKEEPLYYECSHFRPYVGKLIFDRLFQQPHAQQNFGYYVTQDNVEDSLLRIHQDRLKWLETDPVDLDKLHSEIFFSKLRAKWPEKYKPK